MMVREQTLPLQEILLWKTRLRNIKIASLPATTELQSPVAWQDSLFAATFSPQTLLRIDRNSGEIQWRRKLGRIGSSTPVVSKDGLVYITTLSSVECFDGHTGTSQWSYTPHPEANEAFYALPVISRGRLYISSTTGMVHCLNRITGQPVWTHQLTRKGEMVNGTALHKSNKLILGTNTRAVVALDANSGKLLWQTKLDGNCSGQTLWLRGVAVVHTYSTAYFLDPNNGNITWKWQRKGWEIKGATAGKKNLFLQISRSPKDYQSATLKHIPDHPSEKVICLREKTVVWESGTPDYAYGLRALPGIDILCVLAPRRILIYSARTGNYKYTLPVGGAKAIEPSLPEWADCTIYTQSTKGMVYALRLPSIDS